MMTKTKLEPDFTLMARKLNKKAIEWQFIQGQSNTEYYCTHLLIWNKPMWMFHTLRFIAINLDGVAHSLRGYIMKQTTEMIKPEIIK